MLVNDIPVFMAQNGAASLILREIPHRSIAYVQLRRIQALAPLVAECAEFCRGCGAETVLVSQGPEPLPGLVHDHDMLRLRVQKDALPPLTDPVPLLPMTEENDAIYQRVYNRCFAGVSNAATYDRAQIRRIYQKNQQAFLALDGDIPCGMGELHGNELAAVGLLPEFRGKGLSRALTLSLLALCPGPTVELTAASDNEPALGLYDSLGFTVFQRLSAWYRA